MRRGWREETSNMTQNSNLGEDDPLEVIGATPAETPTGTVLTSQPSDDDLDPEEKDFVMPRGRVGGTIALGVSQAVDNSEGGVSKTFFPQIMLAFGLGDAADRPLALRPDLGTGGRPVRPQARAVHRHRTLGPVDGGDRLRQQLDDAARAVLDRADRHGGVRTHLERSAGLAVPPLRAWARLRPGAGHRRHHWLHHHPADRPVRCEPRGLAVRHDRHGHHLGGVGLSDPVVRARA
ncbi:protein of unknown function [Micropruina glycogenica]|uniref:Uncharacterized protein n=1 Tax=Micropruina glycogenica TaxID=75385 RepID=A0A2N9JFW9_9ACTN|nr:protein of unknown function [Micropruina glycogenica]